MEASSVQGERTPVTPTMTRRILKNISRELPRDWCLMPIGGTWMGLTAGTPETTTKDVDLAVVVADGARYTVPDLDDVTKIARRLSKRVKPRKDRASVLMVLEEEEGPVTVELVRGRSSTGGYFVTQRVLEAAASLANRHGQVLELPPEALAFLKAWAAHDQEKLVASGRDEERFHSQRLAIFRDDVRRLRGFLRERAREPDVVVFQPLFAACGKNRGEAIRRILVEQGWGL